MNKTMSDSFDSSDDEADIRRCELKRQKLAASGNKSATNDEDEDTQSDTDFYIQNGYYQENVHVNIPRYAICCLQCKCQTTKKNWYQNCFASCGLFIANNCGNSRQSLEKNQDGKLILGNTSLYHKSCCHGFKAHYEDYQSPMQVAMWNSTAQHNIDEYNKLKEAEAKPLSDLLQSLKTARKKHVMRENLEDDTPKELKQEGKNLEMFLLETSKDFLEVKAEFEKRREEKSMDHPLVIFDFFSGIGSAAVVLKKLQLPIKTMLHVERTLSRTT